MLMNKFYFRAKISIVVVFFTGVFLFQSARPASSQDFLAGPGWACHERFFPSKPMLVLTYEVNYRLFWMNLLHLANAVVYATDGEWFNEATGEWLAAYLLVFHLDTLEEPSDMGRGRYSIHNWLATVLLKPDLKPLFFAKRDFMHVDTFFDKIDVHNTEIFSVEGGRFDYLKTDMVARTAETNLPYFSKLVSQRGEAFRFMKTISTMYYGNTNESSSGNKFTISIYTDNAFVPFNVNIAPELEEIDVLGKEYKAIYFSARPAPGFSGKGRNLAVWSSPFRYVAAMTGDPKLIWLSNNTFDLGMIPLMSEFGLKFGSVRCVLTQIAISEDFENVDYP